MTHHVYEIQIPGPLSDFYHTDSADKRLRYLSRLNVFIGANNSGKSRLLRALFATDPLVYSLKTPERVALREALDRLLAIPEMTNQAGPISDLAKLINTQFFLPLQSEDGRNIAPEGTSNVSSDVSRQLSIHIDALQKLTDQYKQAPRFRDWITVIANAVEGEQRKDVSKRKFHRIYIPTLRGLRVPERQPDYFRKQTVKDYFQGSRIIGGDEADGLRPLHELSIFTGAEVYEEVKKYLLGTLKQRKMIRQFEQFLSTHFYAGKDVALIPRTDASLHVKIGQEAEQSIANLGDGIQQTIILTLPIFLHSDKDLLLFVEEPELFLHPAFQRVWIDLVLSHQCQSLQVFVATHSHQFLDITVDSTRCSIYKFTSSLEEGDSEERPAHYKVKYTSNSDFSVLRELGVRNSSVLLSNCTIWVEGITDRLYLRRLMEVLESDLDINPSGRTYIEDLHYSFVEYGGSSITHFSFLDEEDGIDVARLCGTLFLIADRDGAKWKDERHRKLKDVLADRCEILSVREMENLLSPEVIKSVVTSYEQPGVEFKEFKQEDYATVGLGEFIETSVLAKPSGRRSKSGHPYKSDSGTIKDKTEFCDRAVKEINANDVSEAARELVTKLFSFISTHN